MSLSRNYKSIVSIIKETRDLDTIRIEEVMVYVKVYDKREDIHDERDRFTGTEGAFSSLKVRNNNSVVGNYKGPQNEQNQRWSQNKKGKIWSQNNNWNNTSGSNWNNQGGGNWSNKFTSQNKQ